MLKAILYTALVTMLLSGAAVGAKYSQMYTQNSKDTAIKGILFQQQLNLEHYRNVSSGLNLWGHYDSYTRSDKHTEYITVYCGKYCKQ